MAQLPPAMAASSLPPAPELPPTHSVSSKLGDKPLAILIILGGFGDSLWCSPIARRLHAQGYEVHVHTTEWGVEIFRHNPYVVYIQGYERPAQEQDVIPIRVPEGARIVPCAGVVERLLMKASTYQGRLQYTYGCLAHPERFTFGCGQCIAAKVQRHTACNHNYADTLYDTVGFPELKGSLPELYFTAEEGAWADEVAASWKDKFVVAWSAARTAYHKVYPYWFAVCEEFTKRHANALVYHVGPKAASQTQEAGERILPIDGEWTMRQSMSLLPHFNLVVGGETGFLNAAAATDVAKVLLTSHSTHENLCKHWANHICLQPEDIPCAPCHQTHDPVFRPDSCPTALVQVDKPYTNMALPICMAYGIQPPRVLAAMETFYASSN